MRTKPINAKVNLFYGSRTHSNFVVDKYAIELGHHVVFLALSLSEIIPKAVSQKIMKGTVFMKKTATISDDPKPVNRID